MGLGRSTEAKHRLWMALGRPRSKNLFLDAAGGRTGSKKWFWSALGRFPETSCRFWMAVVQKREIASGCRPGSKTKVPVFAVWELEDFTFLVLGCLGAGVLLPRTFLLASRKPSSRWRWQPSRKPSSRRPSVWKSLLRWRLMMRRRSSR